MRNIKDMDEGANSRVTEARVQMHNLIKLVSSILREEDSGGDFSFSVM